MAGTICFSSPSLLLLLLLPFSLAAVPTHGWDTALSSQFIDFGYSCSKSNCIGQTPFSAEDIKNVASLYSIVSLEKCLGATNTEEAIYESAVLLKQYNPSLKVFFYLATDLGGLHCYAKYKEWIAHPEFWLKDDSGKVLNSSSTTPMIDFTIPEARSWWASIPLNGTGSPAAGIIDGVLADGSGPIQCPNINPTRCAALQVGKAAMVSELQSIFNATNGGTVLQNLITMYPPPSSPADHGVSWLQYSTGAMGEHFAVFESILADGTLNVTRVVEFMDIVKLSASLGKLTVMGTWPGLCTTPFTKDGYPSWPNGTNPTTNDGWRAALLAKHTFALAGYLTVAEENVYMQYEGWYNGFSQGAVPCPTAPETCSAPDPWYPELFKPLGKPLAPAVRSGNTFTRQFEHAVSVLNLDSPDASSVTFSSP